MLCFNVGPWWIYLRFLYPPSLLLQLCNLCLVKKYYLELFWSLHWSIRQGKVGVYCTFCWVGCWLVLPCFKQLCPSALRETCVLKHLEIWKLVSKNHLHVNCLAIRGRWFNVLKWMKDCLWSFIIVPEVRPFNTDICTSWENLQETKTWCRLKSYFFKYIHQHATTFDC